MLSKKKKTRERGKKIQDHTASAAQFWFLGVQIVRSAAITTAVCDQPQLQNKDDEMHPYFEFDMDILGCVNRSNAKTYIKNVSTTKLCSTIQNRHTTRKRINIRSSERIYPY